VNSVSFSPDGLTVALALGTHAASVCELWDVNDARLINGGAIPGHDDFCACVQFSPDPTRKHRALASASGKAIYTSVSNETAKSDAIAEEKAIAEVEEKQAVQLEQAAVEAAAKAAKEAADRIAVTKKAMQAKAELAREAAEADDAEEEWKAKEASRVAVRESLESAEGALQPLKADMVTKLAVFSQIAAELEVGLEEQAEAITQQKATMQQESETEEEAVLMNRNAQEVPCPENEALATEAAKKHEAAQAAREAALEVVKALVASCEKLTEEKGAAYQSASAAKEAFEQADQEVVEYAEQLKLRTAEAAEAKNRFEQENKDAEKAAAAVAEKAAAAVAE